MKFPLLWSGLCCYTEGWGGKCSEILATIKLNYNPRVNKVFTSLHVQHISSPLRQTAMKLRKTNYNIVPLSTINGIYVNSPKRLI